MYVSPHMTQFLFKITPPYCTVHSTVLRILYSVRHTTHLPKILLGNGVVHTRHCFHGVLLDTYTWYKYMVQLQQDPRPQCPSLAPTTRPTVLEENLVTTEPTPNHFHHMIMQSAVFHSTVNPSSPLLRIFVCVFLSVT